MKKKRKIQEERIWKGREKRNIWKKHIEEEKRMIERKKWVRRKRKKYGSIKEKKYDDNKKPNMKF